MSAAGGFSEAAFGGRNTALNHIKKECALAHSRAEARLLRQPSTPAPSAHPKRSVFIVWKRSFLYDEKKQPHREGFVPDTAVLISVYYVHSDSAALAQIMATPAFDCGACSDT